MGRVEVDLPIQIDTEIENLVDQGEFLTRQEAVEELLEVGLSTYQVDAGDNIEEGDLAFADEMRNPGDEPMDPDSNSTI